MAKDTKKRVSRIKTKKKVWCKVLAPAIFGKKEIGESYLTSAEQAQGRSLKVNLKDLTGSMRDQNVYISFKITNFQGTTLETFSTGYELTPAFVKRIVRKNCNRLDDYFVLKTKDGKLVIVKTLMLTLHKVPRSTRTSLRNKLEEYLKEEVSKNTFDSLLSSLVANKIQYPTKKKLAKVYPLKEVAVRKLVLFGDSKPVVKEVKAKVEEAKVEEAKVEEAKVKGAKVKEAKVKEAKVEEVKTKVDEKSPLEPAVSA